MAGVQIDTPSDAELLDLSREGDRAAFGALWKRHRLAGIVAARNIASTLDPDDLVSGAYLKIFELLQEGRGPTGAFRPYLYRVISSLAADTYRSSEYSNIDLTEVPDLTEAGPWEDGAFDLNAAARAFESLPDRWQAALWYSEVEGLAPREIAPMLGLSANGVSALTARAKEGLQSAWVETHLDMQLADEACRSTRGRLQRFQLGKLTSRRSREVSAHLETCDSCTAASAEFTVLNKQLALVLVTILIGGTGAVTLLQQFGIPTGVGAFGSAAAIENSASSSSKSASSSNGAGASVSASIGAGTGGFSVAAALVTAVLGVSALAGAGVLITSILGPDAVAVSPAEATPGSSDTVSSDTGIVVTPRQEALPHQGGDTSDNATDPGTEVHADSMRVILSNAQDNYSSTPVTDPIVNGSGSGVNGGGNSGEVTPPPPPPVDPNLDTSLSIGSVCSTDQGSLGDFQLSADANNYGLIQARIPRTVGPDIYLVPSQFNPTDPASIFVNGEFTDPHGNTFTEGFLTGTDVTQGNFWLSQSLTPLSQWDSSLDDNEFGSISIEVRILKPSGHYSPWTVAYSPLVQPPSC